MADFEKAFDLVMKYEGGYSNDAYDVGGETYKGIARNYYPDWEGWEIIDKAKKDRAFPHNLKHINDLDSKVKIFYKTLYWNAFCGDQIPNQTIANELFDCAVNLGSHRAVKYLQIALNALNRNATLYNDLVEDGVYGPITHYTLIKYSSVDDPIYIVKIINILQGYHYISYMKKSPIQERFARGWLKRVSIVK